MKTAKIFQHGGSQAVRIPKAFRLPGSEVIIERQGEDLLLKPLHTASFTSFSEIARHLADPYPDAADFPAPPPRPSRHERPIPDL